MAIHHVHHPSAALVALAIGVVLGLPAWSLLLRSLFHRAHSGS